MSDKAKPSDPRELIFRAKSGDTDAFGELYRQFFTPIWRYVFFRVGSRQIADDLTQTTFLRVWQSVANFEDRGISPISYFYTTARNLIIDHFERNGKMKPLEEAFLEIPDERKGANHSAEVREIKEMIKKSIATLSPEQGEVIVLKFINELSNKEIAKHLGKTEEAIRQLCSRGLRNLRKKMEREMEKGERTLHYA